MISVEQKSRLETFLESYNPWVDLKRRFPDEVYLNRLHTSAKQRSSQDTEFFRNALLNPLSLFDYGVVLHERAEWAYDEDVLQKPVETHIGNFPNYDAWVIAIKEHANRFKNPRDRDEYLFLADIRRKDNRDKAHYHASMTEFELYKAIAKTFFDMELTDIGILMAWPGHDRYINADGTLDLNLMGVAYGLYGHLAAKEDKLMKQPLVLEEVTVAMQFFELMGHTYKYEQGRVKYVEHLISKRINSRNQT